jgi:hypothetical protein
METIEVSSACLVINFCVYGSGGYGRVTPWLLLSVHVVVHLLGERVSIGLAGWGKVSRKVALDRVLSRFTETSARPWFFLLQRCLWLEGGYHNV